MKFKLVPLIILSASLAGCGSVRLIPPAEVPAEVVEAPADNGWRPYSSGPMQSATPGIRSGSQGSWGGRPASRPSTEVKRSALPDLAPGMAEVITTNTVSETVSGSSPRAETPASGGWKPYAASKTARVTRDGASVFGKGVSSSWAKEYLPESHRIEFGIFAVKAATDGQARMVMPTGEVYSASVVRRNGPCSTLEIGVTEGGDLPIIARGPAEVCR